MLGNMNTTLSAMKMLPVDSEIRLSWKEGGERPVAVIDFGPECEGGYPSFDVSGVQGSPVLRLSYCCHPCSLCDTGDFVHETRAQYMGPEIELPILPASTNRFDLFTVDHDGHYEAALQQGLVRYVRFTLDTPGTSATVSGFKLVNRGTHAPEPIVGAFDCSDPRIAAIWRMSVRTCQLAAIPARTAPLACAAAVKSNGVLGPTYAFLSDGAKRDRLVWSGDLWWGQRNMYAGWGYDIPYMSGSLRMLAENRTPEGYTQACPYPESHGPLASGDYGPFASDEFAAWFLPVLWDHILHSGDRALALDLYPTARDLATYLRSHCRADGLFEQRLETSKHASELDFGAASTWHRVYMNILLWKTYVDLSSLADWLGNAGSPGDLVDLRPFHADAATWRAAADSLAKTIREVFWDAGKGRFKGAIEGDNYQGEGNALALATRFCTPAEADAIRRSIERHPHGKFQALFVRGLYEYGFAEDAQKRLWEHGWKDFIDPAWEGARLTSECLTPYTQGAGDESHPDTSIAGIITDYILGVVPTAPGFASYSVNPHPSEGVTSASGIVPTPWGRIHVSWRLVDGKPVVDCREEHL